jgi:hypothetical protein
MLDDKLKGDEGGFVATLTHELMHVYLHERRRNRVPEGRKLAADVEEGLCELAAVCCLLDYRSPRGESIGPAEAQRLLARRTSACDRQQCAGCSRTNMSPAAVKVSKTYDCGLSKVLRALKADHRLRRTLLARRAARQASPRLPPMRTLVDAAFEANGRIGSWAQHGCVPAPR